LAELGELAGQDLGSLDPHRPFVDDVVVPCPSCSLPARRVLEVIDAWYDSGSMPFAQWGYPHATGSVEEFEQAYPAQFICEGLDQTRGWFYSLMTVGTLVFGRSAYENVVCLGLLLAEDGRKMSKHLGNILEPMPLMDIHGADAVRWFMAASGSPWSARRVGHSTLQEIVRKVLLTYWNTVAFQSLYARANDWTPADEAPALADRPVLDRWLVSGCHRLTRDVTSALENFDTQRAGQLLAEFIDTMSNWYVRRSRRRFWDGDSAALATLHDTLHTLTLLLAPLTPFISERVWQDLVRPVEADAPESVHLASWPSWDDELVDEELERAVGLARRLVELGRAARAEAKVKTRQPLRRALVPSAAFGQLGAELRAEVAAELNLETVESFASAGDLVDHSAKGNFRALGKRFGASTPQVAQVIAASDAERMAADLAATGTTEVYMDGPVKLTADEVIISERPREGWSVVNEHGETVALDLDLTPGLVRAGLAREAIRLVQEARKASGFDVTDRIRLAWSADGELADALVEHGDLVAGEVLAVEVSQRNEPEQDWQRSELGLAFTVAKV
jgi:isoleucyl-tRNA synthetase